MARTSRPPARRARKRFGQHFLEPAWAQKIVRAIAPQGDQTFLEIGPGRGAITQLLAGEAAGVIAVEIDRDLASDLSAAAIPRLRVVAEDFLLLTHGRVRDEVQAAVLGGPLRVAGNLPYNVASPIMFKLVDLYAAGLPILDATVMLQREVAERLLASPGTKEYGVLTVLIRHNAEVRRVLRLPPGAFRPVPKVESTLVQLRFHAPDPPVMSPEVFTNLTQSIFTRRRKTLANALLAYPPAVARTPVRLLQMADIDGRRRPETLTVAELARLADFLVI